MKKILEKYKNILISFIIIIWFWIVYIINIRFNIEKPQIIGAILIGSIYFMTNVLIIKIYKKSKTINWKYIFISIIIIGIILRTTYILYTPINERQHDMEKDIGHLAYIETIYNTGKLPESNQWQFYQQPLHHIISALWLKANNVIGLDIDIAKEGIQNLTAIYSSLIMLITYLILKELNIEDKFKAIIMAVIAVHPTFIILSGSINNDILMIMFTFLSLLYLIKWYKCDNWKNTIILSMSVALGALTKISSTIIAIPILYIFINKFFEKIKTNTEKKEIVLRYLNKFIVFGIISLGIGLSYSLRNKIKFNQSIFYVPDAGIMVYCGNNSWFDRLNIFTKEWLSVYCNPFQNCNMIAYLVKSSLFGEYNLNYTQYINRNNILEIILLVTNIIIILLSLISLIKILKNKKDKLLNMLIIFYFIQILMYFYGNKTKPYACTMDFRYIVPTIFFGMLFIVTNFKTKEYKTIVSIIGLFCMLSIIFELTTLSVLNIK